MLVKKKTMFAGVINRLFADSPKRLGQKGENAAVRFLKRQGYKIVERNFRARAGEIDIVAKDGGDLVFVEVKTRASPREEFLRASVNRSKEKRIAKTAAYYLKKKEFQGCRCRFDVILIVKTGRKRSIDHIKSAFSL